MLFSKMIPTFFRPNLERLDFWRMLPGLRPRATVVLGVHRGTFAQQKLCNRDLAVAYRQVQWRIASGAFSPVWPQWASGEDDGADAEALRMTTEVGGRLSSTDTTDKRTMHVLDSTSSKLFKAKKHAQTHWTLNKFQYIFLTTDIAFDGTIWNNLSIASTSW